MNCDAPAYTMRLKRRLEKSRSDSKGTASHQVERREVAEENGISPVVWLRNAGTGENRKPCQGTCHVLHSILPCPLPR